MLMLTTNIHHRVMPFDRLMNTFLNITNSARRMTPPLYDSLAAHY
jgi:hypothetical protein